MKSTFIILILSLVSFSLSAQTFKEKRKLKKEERKEQERILRESPADIKKVGQHIKNAGWSILGTTITLPYAAIYISEKNKESEKAAIDPEFESDFTRADVFWGNSLIVTSVACAVNCGSQLIKAGWELSKGLKKE